jgi:hypothetical protein
MSAIYGRYGKSDVSGVTTLVGVGEGILVGVGERAGELSESGKGSR